INRLRSATYVLARSAARTSPLDTLSLHDALPISPLPRTDGVPRKPLQADKTRAANVSWKDTSQKNVEIAPGSMVASSCESSINRSEEHTSELQSRENVVCRLLLEKKNIDAVENKD